MKQVASEADLLLVVGSENSSNSNRLVEVARNLGTNAHLIDSCTDIESEWLKGVKTIALTAGASAPSAWSKRRNVPADQRFRQCAGTRSDARKRTLRPAAGDRRGHRRRAQQRDRRLAEEFTRTSMDDKLPLIQSSCDRFEPQLRFGKIEELGSRVSAAIAARAEYLFSEQHEDGYWCGELEADTTLESDYILLHTLLGTGNPERFRESARTGSCAIRMRTADGASMPAARRTSARRSKLISD